MPFQPGHKINEAKGTKRAMKNLALSIREGVHPDRIRDWLIEVWMGRDPLTGDKVELKNRAAALQMLLDRGWGQAAQHVIVDADVRTEMMLLEPKDARPTMTLEEINERRQQLRQLGIKPKVIDVETQKQINAPEVNEDEG